MPNTITIELSPEEMREADDFARLLRMESLQMGYKDKERVQDSNNEYRLEIMKVGLRGESAVAKYLCLPFKPKLNKCKSEADIGDIEVRTRTKPWYDLIVRDDDAKDRRFVHVTIDGQTAVLHGWCHGHEAEKLGKRMNPGGYEPAWFIPAENLRPMENLVVCPT